MYSVTREQEIEWLRNELLRYRGPIFVAPALSMRL